MQAAAAPDFNSKTAAVIGGGPAGLMAAEVLGRAGVKVTVFDRMPSLARKFLMAGRSGLNITHSEPLDTFLRRYGAAAAHLRPAIEAFSPDDLRKWCEELGQPTFTGTSGRVFPASMKASPLLRAWLRKLDAQGVSVRLRHRFCGFGRARELLFEDSGGALVSFAADMTILALGGGSWSRLGSDGGWQEILRASGISVAPLRAANCGFETDWSQHLRETFAGTPLKNIALKFAGQRVHGECTISAYGLEGGAVYALSAQLRDAIEADGFAQLTIDLKPDMSADVLAQRLAAPRGKASLSNHLRKRAGLPALTIALMHETHAPFGDPQRLAAHIKSLPLRLLCTRPLERAISTAGGVQFSELDSRFMLKKMPGIFCAGEMIDWEAPTGGYLLQACMATGHAAGAGALEWLAG